MLSYNTLLISQINPLKYLFEKPVLSERLIFDNYQPMTDLLLDESNLNTKTEEEYPNWHLNFDGAVNVNRNRIGAILISPTGAHSLIATKLKFPDINNITEYDVSPTSNLL